MSNEKQVDSGRRGLLVATCAAGGVAGVGNGRGLCVSTFQPSERAKAAGAPVEVDISDLKPGENDDRRMARQAGLDPRAARPKCWPRCRRHDAELADPNPSATRRADAAIRAERVRARSSPKSWSSSASAPTWAARPTPASSPARSPRCRTTGTAASSAPATVRRSTWPAASSRTSRRRTTSRCRRTCTCRDTKLVIGKDKKGEA